MCHSKDCHLKDQINLQREYYEFQHEELVGKPSFLSFDILYLSMVWGLFNFIIRFSVRLWEAENFRFMAVPRTKSSESTMPFSPHLFCVRCLMRNISIERCNLRTKNKVTETELRILEFLCKQLKMKLRMVFVLVFSSFLICSRTL